MPQDGQALAADPAVTRRRPRAKIAGRRRALARTEDQASGQAPSCQWAMKPRAPYRPFRRGGGRSLPPAAGPQIPGSSPDSRLALELPPLAFERATGPKRAFGQVGQGRGTPDLNRGGVHLPKRFTKSAR
jgi:hypothetical protein